MYADPQEVRAIARRIREQGAQVRAEASDLVDRSRAVGWSGLAGTAMAAQTAVQARVLAGVAEQHEAAARALEAHATAVEEALALIAEIERRVHGAVDAARSRLRKVADGLLDTVGDADETLAGFVPPGPGSPRWLQVRLPGVALPGPPR
ncbi:hypothetical protein GCM10009798_10170 [Nocardioides panacihumi]|uniref:PPE domain-containing protein n=1 Tax=Nocardioides panacihumi TaxID=400774 RepID=A0ABP5BVR3_9ACTN